MSLVQAVYYSSARHSLTDLELGQIMEVSVRRNLASGITGMLLYLDGSFMQVLEGESAAVAETLIRIERDPRHTDIIVIHNAPLAAREFGQWSMGFRSLSAKELTTHPNYAPFFERGFDINAFAKRPDLATQLLKEFGRSWK